LIGEKLSTLRSINTSPELFRNLVAELTSLLIYEATLDLKTLSLDIETPLQKTRGMKIDGAISIVPILRAGLGMVDSALKIIPTAKVWHIGVKRDEDTLEPIEYYVNKPNVEKTSTCIVLDPMLATGGSLSTVCSILKSWGVNNIRYIGLLAAPEGVKRLENDHPDINMFVASIDSHLDENGYIVPGLGDAGDRQFDTL
jgi:uracil phosphoribosyltransferase